jgi:hypothetical protein
MRAEIPCCMAVGHETPVIDKLANQGLVFTSDDEVIRPYTAKQLVFGIDTG